MVADTVLICEHVSRASEPVEKPGSGHGARLGSNTSGCEFCLQLCPLKGRVDVLVCLSSSLHLCPVHFVPTVPSSVYLVLAASEFADRPSGRLDAITILEGHVARNVQKPFPRGLRCSSRECMLRVAELKCVPTEAGSQVAERPCRSVCFCFGSKMMEASKVQGLGKGPFPV